MLAGIEHKTILEIVQEFLNSKNPKALTVFTWLAVLDSSIRHELLHWGHRQMFRNSSIGYMLYITNSITNYDLSRSLERNRGRVDSRTWRELIRYKLWEDETFDDISYVLEASAVGSSVINLSTLIAGALNLEYEKTRNAIEGLIQDKVDHLYLVGKRIPTDFDRALHYDVGYNKYGKRILKIFGEMGLYVSARIALNPTIYLSDEGQEFHKFAFDRFRKIAEIPETRARKVRDSDVIEIEDFILNYFGWTYPLETQMQTLAKIAHVYGESAEDFGEHFPDLVPLYPPLPKEETALLEALRPRWPMLNAKLTPHLTMFLERGENHLFPSYISLPWENVDEEHVRKYENNWYYQYMKDLYGQKADFNPFTAAHQFVGANDNLLLTEVKNQLLEFGGITTCPHRNIISCEDCVKMEGGDRDYIREMEDRLGIKICTQPPT